MRTMVDDCALDTMNVNRPTSREVAPVSVIVPCYRCADTIAEAVASVAAQSLAVAEVVLVDDCSGDGTLERLHALAARYPEGWLQVLALPENGGPSRARNAGWAHASQEYVAFLDSDDTWVRSKIELQMRVLRQDPDIALIAHRMQVRDRHAPAPPPVERARATVIGRRRLLLNNPFPTASVILRRDLPFRFDERFRRVEDFLLWAQIAFSGYRCVKLDRTLAFWHKPTFGAGGLSEDLRAMHAAGREVRRELLRQGLVSLPEHCFARALGYLRRGRQRLRLAWRRANETELRT